MKELREAYRAMIRSMDTRDKNDPEELGLAILATRDKFSCSIVQAADRVYADMRENGQSSERSPGLGATSAAAGSPEQSGAQSPDERYSGDTDEPT